MNQQPPDRLDPRRHTEFLRQLALAKPWMHHRRKDYKGDPFRQVKERRKRKWNTGDNHPKPSTSSC